MDTLELEAVVRQARQGEAQALAEIHRRLSRRVLGLGWHMLGSREEAEDACSEVFMRLPRAITTYDGSIPFERWLLSIASHHCIDRLRRRMREQRLITDQDVEPLAVAISAASPSMNWSGGRNRTRYAARLNGCPLSSAFHLLCVTTVN